jgi:hypothetical protein
MGINLERKSCQHLAATSDLGFGLEVDFVFGRFGNRRMANLAPNTCSTRRCASLGNRTEN